MVAELVIVVVVCGDIGLGMLLLFDVADVSNRTRFAIGSGESTRELFARPRF